MLMTDSRKITEGTFAGSYRAPKKRIWVITVAIVAVVLLLAVGGGWLIWQNEISKKLDTQTYDRALKTSENVLPLHLDDTQRNARFQKHAGITMDAYLKHPRSIKNVSDKYQAAKLLSSDSHYAQSAKLYRGIVDTGTLPENIDSRIFYTEAGQAARLSKDDELAKKVRVKFKESVMKNDSMDDEMKKYIIETYEYENK